jgi:hypothetical protein
MKQEERKLFTVSEQDRFLFKNVEATVEGFKKEFVSLTSDYIYKALQGNSMDINQTYKYLRNPESGIIL